MEKNKTEKYLKYAIGEIVLVVIGILIALSINNWNENRLEKNEVTNYIKQIKTELELDLTHFISDHIEGPLLLMLNYKKDFLVDSNEVIEELENGKLKSLVNWQISYLEYQTRKIKQDITQAEELIDLIDEK